MRIHFRIALIGMLMLATMGCAERDLNPATPGPNPEVTDQSADDPTPTDPGAGFIVNLAFEGLPEEFAPVGVRIAHGGGEMTALIPASVSVARSCAIRIDAPVAIDDYFAVAWYDDAGVRVAEGPTYSGPPREGLTVTFAEQSLEAFRSATQLRGAAKFYEVEAGSYQNVNGSTVDYRAFRVIGYFPYTAGDDDLAWRTRRIRPFGTFLLAANASPRSTVGALVTAVELLPGVTVEHVDFDVYGGETVIKWLEIPSGHRAIAFTTIEGYNEKGFNEWSKDDDSGVISAAWSVGRTVFFAGSVTYCGGDANVSIRGTVIHWPEAVGLNPIITRLHVTSGSSASVGPVCLGSDPVLVTTHVYHPGMTPDLLREAFDKLRRKAQEAAPARSVHTRGVVYPSARALTAREIELYVKLARPIIIWLAKGIGDSHDDDFYPEIHFDHGELVLAVRGGNWQSMFGVTVVRF